MVKCGVAALAALASIALGGAPAAAADWPTPSHVVTMKLTVNSAPVTLVADLYGRENDLPTTVSHFVAACNDRSGNGYDGTVFHRIIPGFMAQGGDITNGNGTGGRAGVAQFADESFALRHREPGLLSMANAGPNTNGSQFFITFAPTSWLDDKHVVFGRLHKDSLKQLPRLEAVGTMEGKPRGSVRFQSCEAKAV